jgi:hypothetical protein
MRHTVREGGVVAISRRAGYSEPREISLLFEKQCRFTADHGLYGSRYFGKNPRQEDLQSDVVFKYIDCPAYGLSKGAQAKLQTIIYLRFLLYREEVAKPRLRLV